MVNIQDFRGSFGYGSFTRLIVVSNLIRLVLELGSKVPIRNVLLCLSFPMVQKSGYSNLPRVSYGHLNIYYSYGHFSRSSI